MSVVVSLLVTFISIILNEYDAFKSIHSQYNKKSHAMTFPVSKQVMGDIGKEISKIRAPFAASSWQGGSSGGGGASVGIIRDDITGIEYFVKTGSLSKMDMLAAEFDGITEIFNSKTIRVPKPIVCSTSDYTSYAVFEKLHLGGNGNSARIAKELCAMHRHVSQNGMFGWKMNNTIGATPQPNTWTPTWSEFWDECRLGHMLRLAKRDGAIFPQEEKLRIKVKSILDNHYCVPSLVHGDLWSGNQAFTREGDPVIFDPAVYVSRSMSDAESSVFFLLGVITRVALLMVFYFLLFFTFTKYNPC